MQLVFDAMRVSSGNSFCWETEVPRMLKGDYYPDFTAEMMHKDITLGLDLGVQYSTVQYSTLMSSKEGEDMSQVNHSFGDGPLVLFSGLFLLATFVGELGKRQGEYKHKKQ